MSETDNIPEPSPWQPITKSIDLKHLGKLAEEINELGSAIARCIIQGLHEREPVSGKLNIEWLEDEIADVLAGINLASSHFKLNTQGMDIRRLRKQKQLAKWHNMLEPDPGLRYSKRED